MVKIIQIDGITLASKHQLPLGLLACLPEIVRHLIPVQIDDTEMEMEMKNLRGLFLHRVIIVSKGHVRAHPIYLF